MVSEINMEKPKSRFIKTDDNTIYDSLTSLTWMANDSRLDKDKELSWDEAQAYLKDMNEKQFGGHSDWRMPTIHLNGCPYWYGKNDKTLSQAVRFVRRG